MMHWKAIWKPGITEITKGSRGFPGPYKGSGGGGGGGYSTPYEPPAAWDHWADSHWVMTYAIKFDPYEKKRSAKVLG